MSYDGRMNYQNRLGMERLAFKAAQPLTPIEQPRMSGEGGPVHLYTPILWQYPRVSFGWRGAFFGEIGCID